MKEPDSDRQTIDGGPLLLLFMIVMVVIVLAALLRFTGAVDFSAWL